VREGVCGAAVNASGTKKESSGGALLLLSLLQCGLCAVRGTPATALSASAIILVSPAPVVVVGWKNHVDLVIWGLYGKLESPPPLSPPYQAGLLLAVSPLLPPCGRRWQMQMAGPTRASIGLLLSLRPTHRNNRCRHPRYDHPSHRQEA
jgi:hypothetical protein